MGKGQKIAREETEDLVVALFSSFCHAGAEVEASRQNPGCRQPTAAVYAQSISGNQMHSCKSEDLFQRT